MTFIKKRIIFYFLTITLCAVLIFTLVNVRSFSILFVAKAFGGDGGVATVVAEMAVVMAEAEMEAVVAGMAEVMEEGAVMVGPERAMEEPAPVLRILIRLPIFLLRLRLLQLLQA